jgi:predicted PurR-regulated permease PerM
MFVGLEFGLVVGFGRGALTFIPYVGALVGGVLAIGLALFQFWGEWWWIVARLGDLPVGPVRRGQHPDAQARRLVSVGLHPVMLIFALSAFGALFGFVGLLVAVPVAAVIGVLVRFVAESSSSTRTASRLRRPLGGRDARSEAEWPNS